MLIKSEFRVLMLNDVCSLFRFGGLHKWNACSNKSNVIQFYLQPVTASILTHT